MYSPTPRWILSKEIDFLCLKEYFPSIDYGAGWSDGGRLPNMHNAWEEFALYFSLTDGAGILSGDRISK